MRADTWLRQYHKQLEDAGINTARLDCLVLLEDALGKDRTQLLAHPEIELTPEQEKKLNRQIKQRSQHIPLAYIRGKTEFYGREFIVNHHVLEPRPESETMIDLLKEVVENQKLKVEDRLHIIDVGTGSGALAVTAKLEVPQAKVWAVDVDQNCLSIAEQNAQKHRAAISPSKSDLLESLPPSTFDTPTILLANLPYVPDAFQINPAAMNEPRLAIFGGQDGLDLYRALFAQAAHLQYPPRFILTEALPPQHEQLSVIAVQNGFSQQKSEDFIQVFALQN